MATAQQVADYFLSLVDEDSGDTISNLKLHKLLYYAQGLHLALYDKPLFTEQIRAWEHGPVIPPLYHKYKEYGAGSIPKPVGISFSCFSKEIQDFLNEVWNIFGQFSAWKLRNMTHKEDPWKDTSPGGIIKRGLLKKYFKRFLKD
ncbi:MAG: Panacea domain-containing protein [Planctomycetota bacterium]|jgi:uncharacterized phage-associated protein